MRVARFHRLIDDKYARVSDLGRAAHNIIGMMGNRRAGTILADTDGLVRISDAHGVEDIGEFLDRARIPKRVLILGPQVGNAAEVNIVAVQWGRTWAAL